VERDWGPELSQHPVKTAIGENLLSEAIHDAKKTAQALYAVQLEDFRNEERDPDFVRRGGLRAWKNNEGGWRP